jgi:glycosyltransferase involved in cell wall biosynthesis
MSLAPSFTVVIPNHARVASLARAVRSALTDAPANVDVIVVDDASPNIGEIASALDALDDARVQLIALPEKSTASHARNVGVAQARGDWVAFLDSDDEFAPGKWQALTLAIATEQDVDVFHDCADIIIDGVYARTVPQRPMARAERVGDYLFVRRELLSTCTLTVRTTVLRRVPWRAGLPRHQDYQLCLDLQRAQARFAHVPCVGARIHWSLATRPAGKGESAAYSLAWLDTARDQLSDRAYRHASFRLGVVKLLEAGERVRGLREALHRRAMPGVGAVVLTALLLATPSVLQRAGYRFYKRVVQPRGGMPRPHGDATPRNAAPARAYAA